MATVGIIQTLTSLPLGVLTPALDANGPYAAGSHTLATWSDGGTIRNVSDTFGVLVQINGSIAPQLGRTFGFVDAGLNVDLEAYDMRIAQLAALHQLVGGSWVADQVVDCHYAPTLIRWAEDLPGRIGLYVQPTWHVDLLFLKTI